MGVRGRSPDGATEIPSRIKEALADAHNEWSIEVEEVSGRIVIEAERKQFHPNGSSAGALALDHPKKAGWVVLAPGNRDVRWRAMYDTGGEAAVALAEITNIFEARRTIKHERPSAWTVRAYYKIETVLLDSLKEANQTG
jgi:hypothetical protein